MPDNYAIDVPKNEAILVSVIIPNYNHGPFLNQRINSILNQTYQNIELIIMDDVSTDGSREVIEQYRNHPKVNAIIYNEQNSGSTFRQWDKGMQLVNGEWVWIAESDDWCEANLLETLVQGVDDSVGLAIAQSVVVKETGEILWKSQAAFFAKIYSGKDFVTERMLLDNFGLPNASMCIFKKELYYQIDKQFTSYKFCGDWLFWIMIALQGYVFVSGKYLNYFRKHDNDVSSGAYYNGLHFSEYFLLLDTLEQKQIISSGEKYDLLKQKLKMFLQDGRLSTQSHTHIAAAFKKLLGMDYYNVLWRSGIGNQLRNLKNSLRS